MKRILMTVVCVAALAACAADPGFTSLFDGKTLEGDIMVKYVLRQGGDVTSSVFLPASDGSP